MCIIIVNPKGELISNEMLIKSALINPHGLGITWLDTYETEYSLSSDWEILAVPRPYIAHFRYATVGEVSLANNHPFEIGTTGCMLYQNGTVFNLGDTTTTDTQAMAEILSLSSQECWGDILELTDCRWVIADAEFKMYDLYNEEMFVLKDNISYSKTNVIDNEIIAVYGTLKQGHGNHRTLGGAKLVGGGKTVNSYDMIDQGIPFVSNKKDGAHNIVVELYMCDKNQLAGVDRLEGHPTNYTRKKTPILMDDGVTIVMAWLYFYQHPSIFRGGNFIPEYTRDLTPVYQHHQYKTWRDDEPCLKCGSLDTMFDDTNHKLYCYSCADYDA